MLLDGVPTAVNVFEAAVNTWYLYPPEVLTDPPVAFQVVNELEAVEDGPVPTTLVAVTVKV
jgi:hypothetical protein